MTMSRDWESICLGGTNSRLGDPFVYITTGFEKEAVLVVGLRVTRK